MKFIKKLPDAEELKKQFALTKEQEEAKKRIITELEKILSGDSKKKILCIGPCSADREDSVLEYMSRLSRVKQEVEDKLLIVPRIYTSKPRTTGIGYKGLVHNPNPIDRLDNLYQGIIAARKIHLDVISETGLYGADEMLYTEAHSYIDDLLVYTAVGARSVENQQHRLVASGLDMPVGMKNPTSGSLDVMINAIFAAQRSQALMYQGWECHTTGNPFAHAILRGYTDRVGASHPNYHYEDICILHDAFIQKKIANMAVIIDCNHNNSNKHYDEQIRISKEIFSLCGTYPMINTLVKGIMVESYLVDGAQKIGEGIYGKSITDPCLGWNKTRELIYSLYEILDD